MSPDQASQPDRYNIVGVGEILWDLLPTGKQLGGAPTNFAYHVHLLGDNAVIASRIGDDSLGREIRDRLELLGLTDDHLQTDTAHPTGTVAVELDHAGQPQYTIEHSVAWDFFQWTQPWQKLAAETQAVCFGSLAQRSEDSRRAIQQFIRAVPPTALRVFDVNLRQSFYSPDILADSFTLANVVKLNEQELPLVARMLNLPTDGEQAAAGVLLRAFELQLLCVTRGENGCLLMTASQAVEHAGFPVTVADAIGAGDAFTAALVYHYLRKTPLDRIARAANRHGSWVAAQTGATPAADPTVLARVTAPND